MADDGVEELAGAFLAYQPDEGPVPGDHDDHGEPGTSTSVREIEHRGHHVRVETTYRITIDGRPLQGHVEVLPSGAVHYHRFPQYAPQSALDVVKTVIDTIWEKPEVPDELGDDGPDHAHDGHDGHEGHH
jgi:hypothetical protein